SPVAIVRFPARSCSTEQLTLVLKKIKPEIVSKCCGTSALPEPRADANTLPEKTQLSFVGLVEFQFETQLTSGLYQRFDARVVGIERFFRFGDQDEVHADLELLQIHSR